MPVHVLELRDSRPVRPDGTTLKWAVVGTSDEATAVAAVVAAAPGTLGSWVRKPGPKMEFQGGKLWFAEYDYGPTSLLDRTPLPGQQGPWAGPGPAPPPPPPPPPAPGANDPITDEWSFQISGQSRRIYTSEETRGRHIRTPFDAADVPDFKKLIGVSKKSVEGTDRIEPKTEFTITKQFEFVTWAYLDKLHELVGTINEADFDPFGKAEELLLLGVSGKGGGQGAEKSKPSLTFSFGKSKNRTNVEITKDQDDNVEILAPVVKGWDYVWCYYLDEPGSNTITTQRALAAYVERIYPLGDYGDLTLYS